MVSEGDAQLSVISIFARAPTAGLAKTRLIPAIGAARAARLHQLMVEETLRTAVQCSNASVELWCTPDIDHPFFRALEGQFNVVLRKQPSGDLGTRLNDAAEQALVQGKHVLLVGTDCPGITASDYSCALQQLAGRTFDAVLGPAADGGYYLLGLKCSAASLFDDVPWGSADVLGVTRKSILELGWRCYELEEKNDVDRPEDLALLDERFKGKY